jgi:two-component SAPR family response regulator
MPSMIRYKYYPISKVAHITSVLIDYKMPNMNGLELYREIRKVDAKVKICFVTAFDIYLESSKRNFIGIQMENIKIKKKTQI